MDFDVFKVKYSDNVRSFIAQNNERGMKMLNKVIAVVAAVAAVVIADAAVNHSERKKLSTDKPVNNSQDHQRKIGLVLSGGGAKGAYEIGVWTALEELGILQYVDGIYGTSVGALNAVLLETCGLEKAREIWENLTWKDFFHVDLIKGDRNTSKRKQLLHAYAKAEKRFIKNYTMAAGAIAVAGAIKGGPVVKKYVRTAVKYVVQNPKWAAVIAVPAMGIVGRNFVLVKTIFDYLKADGLMFSQEKIASLIEENIMWNCQRRTIGVFCLESNRPHNVHYFDLLRYTPEERVKIILASSAIPFFYEGEDGIKIQGKGYFDGGASIPHKCKGVNTPTKEMSEAGWRRIITVWLDHKATPSEIEGAEVVNIIPDERIGDFFTGTLRVNKDKIISDIVHGWQDTMNKKEELMELVRGLSF